MGTQINYASKIVVTTGTTIGVRLLPEGTRVPPVFTITTAAAGTSVPTVTLTAAANGGATSLTVSALSGAIPNNSRIVFSNGVIVRTRAAAASGATTISINEATAAIPSGTTGSYTAGSLTQGSMVLSVAALPVALDAGEVLTFGSTKVTVTDWTPQGATALDILPLPATLTAGATATTNALSRVASPTSVLPSPQLKTVDTTSFASGRGTEMLTTAVGMQLQMSFQMVDGVGETRDRGGDILRSIIYDPLFQGREVYVRVIRPGDGIYQGAAMITEAPQQGEVQDKVVQQATMQYQGIAFQYIPESDVFTELAPGGSTGGGGGTPPSYNTTIQGVGIGSPASAGGVTLSAATTDSMSFDELTSGTSLPVSMNLFVGSTQVAQVDYTDRYVGDPFAYVNNGTNYTGTFGSGSVTLTAA